MIAVCLLGVGLLAASPSDAPPIPPDLTVYEAAQAKVGRDPEAHVKLALWCEAHGLRAESAKQLALAVLIDPRNATARGLMGLVAHRGHWLRPEAVSEEVKSDEARAAALAEYNARREGMPETADAHWKLALWCEAKGLKPEATAHLSAVTQLDPGREDAWKRLGCERYKGRWMSREQAEAERAEDQAQKDADRLWKARLMTWKKRGLSEPELASVTDPRAVKAVWEIFGLGNAEDRSVAVRLLGQLDGPSASHALAYLAVRDDQDGLRRAATESLARRDPRDFVDFLIGLMSDPIRYQVEGTNGRGSPLALLVEGPSYNVRRVYKPRVQIVLTNPGAWWRVSNRAVRAGRREAAREAAWRRDDDIAGIERANVEIVMQNSGVAGVLTSLTGQDLGPRRESWARWWTEQAGYAYQSPGEAPRPTITRRVSIVVPVYAHSCFAAGTPVRTIEGPRPIETLKIGDQVLSQDTTTGALSFEPVVAVYHNPPATIVHVRMDGETIDATGIHRFWKAGQGWTMARDLKPGDKVRTIGGTAEVLAVETDAEQPVFNLEVARNQSFFVGSAGALVHDNSLVEPVARPFDAAPELAEIGPGGK
jgi:hypothetical protein